MVEKQGEGSEARTLDLVLAYAPGSTSSLTTGPVWSLMRSVTSSTDDLATWRPPTLRRMSPTWSTPHLSARLACFMLSMMMACVSLHLEEISSSVSQLYII